MLAWMRNPESAAGPSETMLLDRARAGDREAFDRLVADHLPRVWGIVWRILRHREDTEDVVQEVFLAAYQGIGSFRGDARLATWLQRIAVTRSLNHLDRAAEKIRRASRSIDPAGAGSDDTAGDPQGVPAAPGPSPLQSLEAADLRRRLADCLSRLPGAWRAILALRDAEERSYEEIAALVGIAMGTVRSRLARARIALRRCIEGEAA